MAEYNIITGILNLVNDRQKEIGASNNTRNRLHAIGEPLEEYIKDIFSCAVGMDASEKLSRHQEVFSYGGGKNNPPDAIICNGDAIEIKKVESIGSIPLNSSYPKSKLYINDKRITSYCRNIEQGKWKEKDIIYAIGNVNGKNLKSLALVYGTTYCADKEHYEKIFNTIKQSIEDSSLALEKTNELAHINAVDPLGITYFRARGMWGISHPFKVYSYIFHHSPNNSFELMAIIPSEKFDSFENKNDLIDLSTKVERLKIEDKQVKNPNNTAKLINVKLVTYSI